MFHREVNKKIRLVPLPDKNRSVQAVWSEVRGGFRYEFSGNAALGRGIIHVGRESEAVLVHCVGPGSAPDGRAVMSTDPGFVEMAERAEAGDDDLPEWWQVVGVEVARVIEELQFEVADLAAGGWRVVAALIERRAGHAGLRETTRIHNPSTTAKVVAHHPALPPTVAAAALTSAGISEHAEIAAQALADTDNTDQDALDVLSGINPAVRRLDRLADLAFDDGWNGAQIKAIDDERSQHAGVIRRKMTDDEALALETLVSNGCGENRARSLALAGDAFSWGQAPVEMVSRYGPRNTAPVGIRFFGPALGKTVYEEQVNDPDLFEQRVRDMASGRVVGAVEWSTDGGVIHAHSAKVAVAVDGTVTFLGGDPVPDLVSDRMQMIGEAVAVAGLSGVDLLCGASPLPTIHHQYGVTYEYGNETGWVDVAGEVLGLVRAGERVPAGLERRLVVALVREPTEVSSPVLLEALGVSGPYVGLLAAIDDVKGVTARLVAADQVMSSWFHVKLTPRVALQELRERRYRDNWSTDAVTEDVMRAALSEALVDFQPLNIVRYGYASG